MIKNALAYIPRGAEEAPDEGLLPFATEKFEERFWALLDDDDVEEAFREFRVDLPWPE